jgi:hypothetical protein
MKAGRHDNALKADGGSRLRSDVPYFFTGGFTGAVATGLTMVAFLT